MPIPEQFHEPLFQEFASFYECSELPESWNEWLRESLDEEASIGASRMRSWLDHEQALALAHYLRAEADKRHGELIQKIESWTRFAWSHADEDWHALQTILRAIAERLEHEQQVPEEIS